MVRHFFFNPLLLFSLSQKFFQNSWEKRSSRVRERLRCRRRRRRRQRRWKCITTESATERSSNRRRYKTWAPKPNRRQSQFVGTTKQWASSDIEKMLRVGLQASFSYPLALLNTTEQCHCGLREPFCSIVDWRSDNCYVAAFSLHNCHHWHCSVIALL